jgi:hypothetical protein
MSVRFKALVLVSDRTRGIRRCSSSFVSTNQTELINLVVFSVGKRRPPLIANWIKRSNFAAVGTARWPKCSPNVSGEVSWQSSVVLRERWFKSGRRVLERSIGHDHEYLERTNHK